MYTLPSTSYVAEETQSNVTRRHESACVRRRLSERLQPTILNRATLLQCARTALVILCLLGSVADAQKVRCFCDRRNCADQLMCDADYCLVGFKSDVRLDQKCGVDGVDTPLQDCQENWNSWVEVCACRQDFCNTFNYLRTQMERIRAATKRQPPSSGEKKQKTTAEKCIVELAVSQLQYPAYSYGGVPDPDMMGRSLDQPIYKSNQLVILLVVVPLGVGAAAVCLVFLNYHCKMC